ncbi:DUF4365 domain-containing protein [Aliarcobacter skirrowii]|uniref:DUF4365 domain-containing protein n=1 Tax=Aliarcobacter skirrowii TaxID=28200 RepID=UPI0029A00290|nr:DUF4365 domain-containing protein [Aliarcobacter skirrowii]MDX4049133.1 DUF4365 domain-containing protein [Aliarcobacter skirrowii]
MDMPIRSTKHQVEDISINEFKRLLPREWVYRVKDNDYGIDGEVEVFDENNRATGLMFLVQLKATDLLDPKVQTRVQLDNSTINYFASLELPVLIVRYIEESKKIYFKWAHSIDRYKQKEGANSFTFHMQEKNLWGDNTPQKLVDDVKKVMSLKNKNDLLPLKIYLNFEFDNLENISTHRLKSNFRTFIDQHQSFVKLVSLKEQSILTVNLTDEILHIEICGFGGCYFHSINSYPYTYDELIGDMFLAIAIGLFHLGKTQNAFNIFETLVTNGIMLKNPQVLMLIIPEYAKIGNSSKVIELWESIPADIKDDELNMQYQLITTMSSKYNNSPEMHEHFLLEQIEKYEKLNEKMHLGIAYYNYANFLRMKDLKKSFHFYNKALKYNTHYCTEDYIFKEMAGLLWDLDRFEMSAKCYKKGLELKEDLNSIVLYADALMFQGKYLESKNKFIEYFEKKKEDIHPEWHLKESILGIIVDDLKIKEQKRNYKKAMNTKTIKNCNGQKIPDEEYEFIIDNIDALNPLCHFNLAISCSNEDEHFGTMVHFLISALVNRKDKESWLNSIKGALNCQSYNIIPNMIYCAYDLCGEEFIDSLYALVEGDEKSNSEATKGFLELIDSIIEKVNEENSHKGVPLLRLFNGKKFEAVNLKI